MPNNDEGGLVGQIRPAPDNGRPLFRRINRRTSYNLTPEDSGIVACDHPVFVMDEEWLKVYCDSCKQELTPFALLLRWDEWESEQERKAERWMWARRDMLRAHLRELATRQFLTDADRDCCAALINRLERYTPYRPEACDEAEELIKRLEGERTELRRQKRRERKYGMEGGSA